MDNIQGEGGRRPFGHPIMAEIPRYQMAKVHFQNPSKTMLIRVKVRDRVRVREQGT